MILSDSVKNAATIWASEARAQPQDVPSLLIAGLPDSGRTTFARAAASAAGLSLVELTLDVSILEKYLRTARHEARWYQAALLLEAQNNKTDWPTVWNAVAGSQCLLLVSLPPDATEEAAHAVLFDTTLITLEEPDPSLRRQLWQKMSPQCLERETDVVGTLASSFRFNPGRIGIQRVEVTRDSNPIFSVFFTLLPKG